MITVQELEQLDPKEYIIIKGARVNNLQNVNVAIKRNTLTVVTGVSGSGKSSLAFDTLFAEGQRMYVESLSSYARQFLGRMEKPEVDYIKGVAPAIAIEQKVSTKNIRSTVGTSTEIYDYFKLLFARVGKTISPVSGKEVKKDTVSDVIDYINSFEEKTKLLILAPFQKREDRTWNEELPILLQQGFSRLSINDELVFIEELIKTEEEIIFEDRVYILIDRAVVQKDENSQFRLADSVQTAFYEGQGECLVDIVRKEKRSFSDRFELDGITFEEPSVNFFTFNNPYGACQTCGGTGNILGIDNRLVIPNENLSLYEGAVVPWNGEKMRKWKDDFIEKTFKLNFPIHRPYKDLTEKEKDLLWNGDGKRIKGINNFFDFLESKRHKIQYRVMLSRYRGRTVCGDCEGTRLRKDASFVKVGDKSIQELVLMPIDEVQAFFETISFTNHEEQIAGRIIIEIKNRLFFLKQVGLGYLTLNRLTGTLSGGEFQRIKLATSLGSALVGSMYILDEPSIGLHPRDTERLIEVLKTLKDLGNTVIVVEHEEEVMRAADQIIDIGPNAGSHGGNLIFQGTLEDIKENTPSYTAKYLHGLERIEVPAFRRKVTDFLQISGARANNLKNIDVRIPLHTLSCITGVSGSGKSTLIKKILYPALRKSLGNTIDEMGAFDKLEGSVSKVKGIEFINQSPIGKSSRSNPVTYVKAYDEIRNLYANLPLAKQRNYKPKHFSFNVEGGRCEECQGEGTVKIEMQFMADILLTCESCKGKRFKKETLEVTYNDKAISDILDLTVDDAIEFFQEHSKIVDKLIPLQKVGLGYIGLGQSSNSLSGGEAQRVKLASFLGKDKRKEHTLFVFDEPTTGLHFHDIAQLLSAINALVDNGHSVVIIEHNMEVIKSADWVIDLGPEGGDKGGYVIFEGTPEDFKNTDKGYTAQYITEKLEERK
ncbi:MAG: excinuclease ABC subunit UvrA [Cytophagales bacterium]|nr:excinuclease ABC subunit UvrA [Cytophagales bacterium]